MTSLSNQNATFNVEPISGSYVLGDPWVVGPVTIPSIAPASIVLPKESYLFTSKPEDVILSGASGRVSMKNALAVAPASDRKIRLVTVTGTTGVTAGQDYFLVDATDITNVQSFKLATTKGGTPVTLTGEGSGSISFYSGADRRINGAQSGSDFRGTTGSSAADKQAFDALDNPDALGSASLWDYNDSRNVDPGAKGQPLTLAVNEAVVKAVSNPTPGVDGRNNVNELSTLTAVASPPPAGSFRPYAGSPNKTALFNIADLDLTGLPALALPADATMPTIDQVIAKLGITQVFFTNNLFTRSINPQNTMSQYGADIANDVGQALLWLCLSGPSAEQKKQVATYLVQAGLDVCWRTINGGRWPSLRASFGGGHHWVKPLIVFAAWALRNAPNTAARDLLAEHADKQRRNYFQSDLTIVRVDRGDILSPSTSTRPPFIANSMDFMENALEWSGTPSASGSGYAYNQLYRTINGAPHLGIILAIRLIMGETGWNNPDFFEYHDRHFNDWQNNGQPNNDGYFPPFQRAMVRAYFANAGTRFSETAAPAAIRTAARNRSVWIEYDRLLDARFTPAASALAITVDGAPVAIPAERQTTCSYVAGSRQITVADATGIVVGMRMHEDNHARPVHVIAIDDKKITVSAGNNLDAGKAKSDVPVRFSSVTVFAQMLAVNLPVPLAQGQAVTIGYTAPGSNAARSLGGVAVPDVMPASVPNATGQLPVPATGIVTVSSGAVPQAQRQFSGAASPPAETVSRMRLSFRNVFNSVITDGTFLSSATGSTGTFRLYAPGPASLRIFIGGRTFRLDNIFSGSANPVPTGVPLTWHLAFDFPTGTMTGAVRWTGGERLLSYVGTGVPSLDISAILLSGLYIGAVGNPTGTNAFDGAWRELTIGWGDATLPLPANFSGPSFAHDASWGGNGELPWGGINQLYYAGTLDEWNGSVINRGSGLPRPMTPRRIDATTDEAVTDYIAV